MDDIRTYNDIRSKVMARLQDIYEYNRATLVIGNKGAAAKERLQKEQLYLEYIASILIDLPMPD